MTDRDPEPDEDWEYHTGPVTLRRSRMPGTTTDQRLLDSGAAPTGCTPTPGG